MTMTSGILFHCLKIRKPLVANGYLRLNGILKAMLKNTKRVTQKEGINYKETFSPVSSKDSLRIILALVAHYDLELHQMDVKTAFLNGDIDETIYMKQPENFVSGDAGSMVCRLKKSIYGLKQASRQWYYKFHQVVSSFGFESNIVDEIGRA